MARVTVEDCLQHVENRFALVIMTIKRAREIYNGSPVLVRSKNKEIVTALREIAAGKVRTDREVKQALAEKSPEDAAE